MNQKLKYFFYKWNLYQRERFPLLTHCIMILAFSSSAVSFSAITNHSTALFSSYIVAFLSCFCFFLQLRIADEFKDYEDDCLYRSYRPVPKGIIKLKELKYLFLGTAFFQFIIVCFFNMKLIPFLLATWFYLFLMSYEFGVKKWLKKHPITYILSHMFIMPLIDFFATSTDWINRVNPELNSIYWFIILSFFNGINLEIGRKIRSPQNEEKGVETYSYLWGKHNACFAWFFTVLVASISAIFCATHLPPLFFNIIISFVVIYLFIAFYTIKKFLKDPIQVSGKKIETLSGIFTLCIYLLLGLIPYFYILFSK